MSIQELDNLVKIGKLKSLVTDIGYYVILIGIPPRKSRLPISTLQ